MLVLRLDAIDRLVPGAVEDQLARPDFGEFILTRVQDGQERQDRSVGGITQGSRLALERSRLICKVKFARRFDTSGETIIR